MDGEWYPREHALSGMAEALLRIAGELYLPFLVANAEAFARGVERLEIDVWGLPYGRANHPAGRDPLGRLGRTQAGIATLRSRTKASHFADKTPLISSPCGAVCIS